MFLILFKWIQLIYWGLFFVPLKGFPIFLHVNVPLTALFNYIYTAICLYYWAQSDLFRLRHLLGAHEEAEDEFHLENVLWLGDRAGLKKHTPYFSNEKAFTVK